MNDAASAAAAESRHAMQLTPGADGLARYVQTRAARPRLNLRKVVGVLNALNPAPGSKGKAVAAVSSVRAESSSPITNLYAESFDTNGARELIGPFTWTGMESSVCAFSTIRNASAWMVWTNPRTAFCWPASICADPMTLRI